MINQHLGKKQEYDCQCDFCKTHYCILESNEHETISKCFHKDCEENKNEKQNR